MNIQEGELSGLNRTRSQSYIVKDNNLVVKNSVFKTNTPYIKYSVAKNAKMLRNQLPSTSNINSSDAKRNDDGLTIVTDEERIARALIKNKMPVRDIGLNSAKGSKGAPLSSKPKGKAVNLDHLDALYQQRRHQFLYGIDTGEKHPSTLRF